MTVAVYRVALPPDHSYLHCGRTIATEYEEIEVGGNRPVASLAGSADIEAQTIRELNPELLQG